VLLPVLWSGPVAGVLLGRKIPGAGMDPGSIKPFQTASKDGFSHVACVDDYMYVHGDKYGDNRAQYALDANVSIVHYTAHVPAENRQLMSHEVCFSFCRTVQDMGFFGIANGRDCYCTPYYRSVEGDDSMCDAVCEGGPGTVCGGKTKSSIFSMHSCTTTGPELSASKTAMINTMTPIGMEIGMVEKASSNMQTVASNYQSMFGAAADPVAAGLMQTALVEAGRLEQESVSAKRAAQAMQDLETKVNGFLGNGSPDFTDAGVLSQAQALDAQMNKAVTEGKSILSNLKQDYDKVAPAQMVNASLQYYPVMYFVDKSYENAPSTCGGTAVSAPKIGSQEACASACNAAVHTCVGFSWFIHTGPNLEGLCFLMSKLESTTFYTKCPGVGPTQSVRCYAKFSKFNGATLKPDASGKCDLCLKAANRADRCFR